jgi:integrase
MLFSEYIPEWSESATLGVSKGWHLCQLQIIRDHIMPILGKLCLSKITPSDISKVIQASKDKGHSENQQRKIYNVLSKIFKDAKEFHDYIERSPVRKAHHRPKVGDVDRAYMEPEQSELVLQRCMFDKIFGTAVWIQLLTGIRVSEVQALTWDQIDWKKDCINVTKAYNRHLKQIQPHTKNKTKYRVPMTPRLKTFLQKKMAKSESKFVNPNPDGGMMSHKSYDEFLKRLQQEMNLPISSSHGLRHSCARMYSSNGCSDELLQILLGHKSISSTKVYTHHEQDDLFDFVKKKLS